MKGKETPSRVTVDLFGCAASKEANREPPQVTGWEEKGGEESSSILMAPAPQCTPFWSPRPWAGLGIESHSEPTLV